MYKTYSLKVVEFIDEVKKYRQIWDINDNKYKTRKKVSKVGVWKDVAKALIPDYESMNQAEKLEISRKLYSKWRNMKDSHIRMLRKKNASVVFAHLTLDQRARRKVTPYIYAKHLSFINSQYNYSPGDVSANVEPAEKVDTFTVIMSRSIDSDSTTSDDDTLSLKSQKKDIEFVDTPVQSSEINFLGTDPEINDDDRSFFDSTLPAVREFNMDQKLEFRCMVIKLIGDIRSKAA